VENKPFGARPSLKAALQKILLGDDLVLSAHSPIETVIGLNRDDDALFHPNLKDALAGRTAVAAA
jgi:hypothetical protein